MDMKEHIEKLPLTEEEERKVISDVSGFICAVCGQPLFPGFAFCPHCGAILLWPGQNCEAKLLEKPRVVHYG